MEPRTSVKDYRNHRYSGPRKSRKRVQGQMKRYYGDNKSRNEIWCKKIKIDDSSVPSNSVRPNNTLKTYSRNKKKDCTEANFTQQTANSIEQQISKEDPTLSKPLDINWPLINPTVISHELVLEHVPIDDLAGLSGNRIVDLPHVLQWAFQLERHHSQCKSSSILYVGELKDGFNSVFTFKCSVCGKQFRYSNEKVEKLNKAFVRGTVTAGSYYTQAAHITNLMDIPTISANEFRKIEDILGDVSMDPLQRRPKGRAAGAFAPARGDEEPK